ncbi:hypothetical protein [Herminiimonas contaminans]|uniref:Uncharacterized protein n=1 Tax=Herminiimonas contaminans TaxID=1111140 RepID=A0ABS0EXS6_9BURK|nr:hypothetical protein [Herminiimonas contaminans]MBF8179648.1 hypothetical protein [Herminiimonas contaminans]
MKKPFVQQAPPPRPVAQPKPLRQLSPAELDKARQARDDIHAHQPELIPMIKQLQELGMIDGWRSVSFTEKEENENK